MKNIIPFKDYIERKEFEELSRRVEYLENLITRRSEPSYGADHFSLAGSISSIANSAGVLFGCSLDPIDLYDPKIAPVISSEFSILQCEKASIPTRDMIQTPYGHSFNWSIADDISVFTSSRSIMLKDGSYLNFTNQKHDRSLGFAEFSRWLGARISRHGFSPPEYADLVSDFISDEGLLIETEITKSIGFKNFVFSCCETFDRFGIETGLGLSIPISNIFTSERPVKLKKAVKILKELVESGCPLQFFELKCVISDTSVNSKKVLADNLDFIKESGIPEIHLGGIMVRKNINGKDGSAAYEDFLDAIASDSATSVFSLGCPYTLPGYELGIFDSNMRKTSTYEMIKRSFWRMTI